MKLQKTLKLKLKVWIKPVHKKEKRKSDDFHCHVFSAFFCELYFLVSFDRVVGNFRFNLLAVQQVIFPSLAFVWLIFYKVFSANESSSYFNSTHKQVIRRQNHQQVKITQVLDPLTEKLQ